MESTVSHLFQTLDAAALIELALIVVGALVLITLEQRLLPWAADKLHGYYRHMVLASVPLLRLVIIGIALLLALPIVIEPSWQNMAALLGTAGLALGNQLTQHGAPMRFVQIGAAAEGRQAGVAVLRHLVGHLAAQHVDQVAGAEAARAEALLAVLLEAVDAAEQLARRLGGVPDGRRMETVVAVAAGLAGFTEVREKRHPAAVRRLGQAEQGVELAHQAAQRRLKFIKITTCRRQLKRR